MALGFPRETQRGLWMLQERLWTGHWSAQTFLRPGKARVGYYAELPRGSHPSHQPPLCPLTSPLSGSDPICVLTPTSLDPLSSAPIAASYTLIEA